MSGASWINGQPSERHTSTPASPASPRTSRLLAELLIEDLADEAIDRDRIEADVRSLDDPGIDDLSLRELLEHALDMAVRVPLVAPDPQLLALERDARRVAEAEHPRDQALIHQLRLVERLAVGRAAAGADDESRRHLDAPAHLDRAAGLVVLGSDQDVGQHVIARDDSGERLADHLRLVEHVTQELWILPVVRHAG